MTNENPEKSWWKRLTPATKVKLCYHYFPSLGYDFGWLQDYQISFIYSEEEGELYY